MRRGKGHFSRYPPGFALISRVDSGQERLSRLLRSMDREKGRSVSGNIWGRMMRQNMSGKRQNGRSKRGEEEASVHRKHASILSLSSNKISSRNTFFPSPSPTFQASSFPSKSKWNKVGTAEGL